VQDPEFNPKYCKKEKERKKEKETENLNKPVMNEEIKLEFKVFQQ
jgi:hypothetical protein